MYSKNTLLPVQVFIRVNDGNRVYALPIRRIKQFENFKVIIDDLLYDCQAYNVLSTPCHMTPHPGNWEVLSYWGLIHNAFWADFLFAGARYWIVQRRATMPPQVPPKPPKEMNPYGPVGRGRPAHRVTKVQTYAEVAASGSSGTSNSVSSGEKKPTRAPDAPGKKLTRRLLTVNLRDAKTHRFIRSFCFDRNITIMDLIRAMQGKPGSKIQLLNRIGAYGNYFKPGLSYMWATRKTLAEVGWNDSGYAIDEIKLDYSAKV